jgi:hypothetical protein
MRAIAGIALLAAALLLPLAAQAAALGGVDFATQYDYREFYAATDNRNFLVVLEGNPYPGMDPSEVARRLLPVMQTAKPPPRLTFTYDKPAEPQRPDYRMVLVFDPALNLGADAVCRGEERHRPQTQGRVYIFAVYCRNDQAMSQVTGWTTAPTPEDPDMLALFKVMFAQLYSYSEVLRPSHKPTFR